MNKKTKYFTGGALLVGEQKEGVRYEIINSGEGADVVYLTYDAKNDIYHGDNGKDYNYKVCEDGTIGILIPGTLTRRLNEKNN